MHKKFEINRDKIKDCCQLGRKVVSHNSKSDLPLVGTCLDTYYVKSENEWLYDTLFPSEADFMYVMYLFYSAWTQSKRIGTCEVCIRFVSNYKPN